MILDSNIVIYAFGPDREVVRPYTTNPDAGVSAISYVEVLGFHRIAPSMKADFEEFFAMTAIFAMSALVLDRAVDLRQKRKMGLGDAIIAATALVHDRLLVTRNTADFGWVPGLKLINPFAPPSS